jgi:hypothetical protein
MLGFCFFYLEMYAAEAAINFTIHFLAQGASMDILSSLSSTMIPYYPPQHQQQQQYFPAPPMAAYQHPPPYLQYSVPPTSLEMFRFLEETRASKGP